MQWMQESSLCRENTASEEINDDAVVFNLNISSFDRRVIELIAGEWYPFLISILLIIVINARII